MEQTAPLDIMMECQRSIDWIEKQIAMYHLFLTHPEMPNNRGEKVTNEARRFMLNEISRLEKLLITFEKFWNIEYEKL